MSWDDDDFDMERYSANQALQKRIAVLQQKVIDAENAKKEILVKSRMEVVAVKVELKKALAQIERLETRRLRENAKRKRNLDKNRDNFNAKRREGYQATRKPREFTHCVECGNEIPDTRKTDAKCCSEKCSAERKLKIRRANNKKATSKKSTDTVE